MLLTWTSRFSIFKFIGKVFQHGCSLGVVSNFAEIPKSLMYLRKENIDPFFLVSLSP
jgi:hypothetical protein